MYYVRRSDIVAPDIGVKFIANKGFPHNKTYIFALYKVRGIQRYQNRRYLLCGRNIENYPNFKEKFKQKFKFRRLYPPYK